MSGEITEIVFNGESFPVDENKPINLPPHKSLCLKVGDKITIKDPDSGIECEQTITAIDREKNVIQLQGCCSSC